MAKILSTVTLSAPTGNVSNSVGNTFTMTQKWTYSGSGSTDTVNLTWQYDQGTATWIDIPTTGTTGLVANSGAQNGASNGTSYSRTITCYSVAAYVIRARANDTTNSTTKYSTSTPTITTSAASALAGLQTVNGLTKESIADVNALAKGSIKVKNGLA